MIHTMNFRFWNLIQYLGKIVFKILYFDTKALTIIWRSTVSIKFLYNLCHVGWGGFAVHTLKPQLMNAYNCICIVIITLICLQVRFLQRPNSLMLGQSIGAKFEPQYCNALLLSRRTGQQMVGPIDRSLPLDKYSISKMLMKNININYLFILIIIDNNWH